MHTNNKYKPALYIDAFLTDDTRHKIFNHNVLNFSKAGWDIFIISNKMSNFGNFSSVKYFEFDSTNRILRDKSRYEIPTELVLFNQLSDGTNTFSFHGRGPSHGFTNLTLLRNLRRACSAAKSMGHTHLIASEYDVSFKDYNLMETIFKDFYTVSDSKDVMIQRSNFGWACITSLYLINVDTVLAVIPELNTVDDYDKFLISKYNKLSSPGYERLFADLFFGKTIGESNLVHFVNDDEVENNIDRSTFVISEGDTLRNRVVYKNMLLCPVNNNSKFLINNMNVSNTSVFVEYVTKNYKDTFLVNPGEWRLMECDEFVKVTTSEMLAAKDVFNFDLKNESYEYTFTKI